MGRNLGANRLGFRTVLRDAPRVKGTLRVPPHARQLDRHQGHSAGTQPDTEPSVTVATSQILGFIPHRDRGARDDAGVPRIFVCDASRWDPFLDADESAYRADSGIHDIRRHVASTPSS